MREFGVTGIVAVGLALGFGLVVACMAQTLPGNSTLPALPAVPNVSVFRPVSQCRLMLTATLPALLFNGTESVM